jgi:hypothetical protein
MTLDLKTFVIPVVSTIVAFSITFGGLKAEVTANTDKLKTVVTNNELKLVLEGQQQMNDGLNKRLDRLEIKIDRLAK